MATWQEVKTIISTVYPNNGISNDDCVWFFYDFNGTKPSQQGIVMRRSVDADEWVDIFSQIENLSDVHLDTVLQYLGRYLCGGLMKVEGIGYVVRASIPLAVPLDILVKPIGLIPLIASEINGALSSNGAN